MYSVFSKVINRTLYISDILLMKKTALNQPLHTVAEPELNPTKIK